MFYWLKNFKRKYNQKKKKKKKKVKQLEWSDGNVTETCR